VATLGFPGSAGVPAGAVADTVVAPYNEIRHRRTVACVIVEPVAANMGLVAPEPDSSRDSGRLVTRRRSPRARRGHHRFPAGPRRAAAHLGIRGDLSTLGKVIGGGLPLAAVGGRRELMEQLAPVGPVYQAGTLSATVATAAGLAVTELLPPERFDDLAATVDVLAAGLREAISSAGLPVQIPVVRTLFGIFFGEEPVRDFDGAKQSAASGSTSASSGPCSPGCCAGAERLRGGFLFSRTHRKRRGADRRGCRAGGKRGRHRRLGAH